MRKFVFHIFILHCSCFNRWNWIIIEGYDDFILRAQLYSEYKTHVMCIILRNYILRVSVVLAIFLTASDTKRIKLFLCIFITYMVSLMTWVIKTLLAESVFTKSSTRKVFCGFIRVPTRTFIYFLLLMEESSLIANIFLFLIVSLFVRYSPVQFS